MKLNIIEYKKLYKEAIIRVGNFTDTELEDFVKGKSEIEEQKAIHYFSYMKELLLEVSQDYTAPNFTDRHGTGKRITDLLKKLNT